MSGAEAGSAAVSVMLIVPDAEAAVAWYKNALDATELWNLGGVAGLEVGGAPFFLHEADPAKPAERSPVEIGVTGTRIELFVDDPGAVLERAAAAGAQLRSEIREHRQPWGPTARAASTTRSATSDRSATSLRSRLRATDQLPGASPPRSSASKRSRSASTIRSRIVAASASESVRSGAWNSSAIATDLRPAPSRSSR